MAECELLSQCGFFKKHGGAENLACKGFIQSYCKGPKMNQCKRKEYRQAHSRPPEDDMLPSGQMLGQKPVTP